MGLSPACPPRGPSGPSPRTGDASVWPCADPFGGKVLAWGDFVPRLVDTQLSEAWGTGEVVDSCEDVLTFVDFHTAPLLRTAAGADRPVASVVAGNHAVAAAGGRLGLAQTSSAVEPCVFAYLV